MWISCNKLDLDITSLVIALIVIYLTKWYEHLQNTQGKKGLLR